MTCHHCGATAPEGTTFCPSCGEMLLEAPATPAAPAPSTGSARPQVPQPQVVPVPQRPTRQRAPQRPRTRIQFPPPAQPSGPSIPQNPTYRGPFGDPYRQRVQVRRGPGCGTVIVRTMLLLLALPMIASFLLPGLGSIVLGPAEQEPAPLPTASATPRATSGPTFAPVTPVASPTLTVPGGDAPSAAPQASGGSTYPTLALTGQECRRAGTGRHAATAAGNGNTTCAFAVAVQDAYLKAGGSGSPLAITAWSEARQAQIPLTCEGDQPVRCTSNTGALVYLYGGQATFR